jgi:hypothetical protein
LQSQSTRRLLVGAVAVVALLILGGAVFAATSGGGVNGMTISASSPTDGAQVSIPFDVTIQSNVPLGPPETGNHHAHLYFDTGTDATDYDIVYGNTWQVTRQLSPGKHTIIVAMANPDHSLAGPQQTFTVNVGGAGGGSGAPGGGSPAPPPSQPGYSY